MSYYHNHQKLIKEFRLEIQPLLPDLKLFNRHVGLFVLVRFIKMLLKGETDLADWPKYQIKINYPGMSDMYGLLKTRHGLIHLEFEFKTGNAKQTPEQKRWEKFITNSNGMYFLVKNKDYAHEVVKLLKENYEI